MSSIGSAAPHEESVEPTEDVSEVSRSGVTVRYWAAARAAVGTPQEELPLPASGQSVAELLARVTADREARVAQVVAICSVLVDEQAVHADRLGETVVRPGAVVDLLPPFAGG